MDLTPHRNTLAYLGHYYPLKMYENMYAWSLAEGRTFEWMDTPKGPLLVDTWCDSNPHVSWLNTLPMDLNAPHIIDSLRSETQDVFDWRPTRTEAVLPCASDPTWRPRSNKTRCLRYQHLFEISVLPHDYHNAELVQANHYYHGNPELPDDASLCYWRNSQQRKFGYLIRAENEDKAVVLLLEYKGQLYWQNSLLLRDDFCFEHHMGNFTINLAVRVAKHFEMDLNMGIFSGDAYAYKGEWNPIKQDNYNFYRR